MRWYDVTMPLRTGMPCFPGDPPFEARIERSTDQRGGFQLSRLTLGSHTGTHLDPPSHVYRGGATVEEIELSRLNGPCHLLRIPEGIREIGAPELARVPTGTVRLLLRTDNSIRWAAGSSYFPDYAALNPSAADELVARGIRLVGVDGLSVEPERSVGHPVHRRLLGAGVIVVEGLCLDGVPEGPAELRCLPMRLAGGDGAPVRAALLVG